MAAIFTPSGLSFSRGGPGLRGLGLHCPRPASVGGARSLMAAFPALGQARPVSVKPVPEPGLEKQQRETLARLAVQVKTGKHSSLVRGCSRRVGFGGGGGWGRRGRHHSVRFKGACARGVARALIEHPRSTGGRGVHAGRAAWVWGRGARAPVAGERRAGGGRARRRGRGARAGRAARGCVSSLAPALAGWRAPPLPSRAGNPGRVVAAAAYVSAVSRRGRAGRPGGRERSLGGRAAAAERGGGPRRAGGGRGSRSREPSRAVRGGAARPVPPLVAGRGELREDLAALQPGDWGRPGNFPRSARPRGPGRRAGRRAPPGPRPVGARGRCGSGRAGREGGGCAPSLP